MIKAKKYGMLATIQLNCKEVDIVLDSEEDKKRLPLMEKVEKYAAEDFLSKLGYVPATPLEEFIDYLKSARWEIISYDPLPKRRRNYPKGTVF